jgi:hypothetical protein
MSTTERPQGPFCQSCGMPLASQEDLGTEVDGTRSDDYCRYCFQAGGFTDPDITRHAMAEKCARLMAQQGVMPEGPAQVLMMETLPTLKRWRR